MTAPRTPTPAPGRETAEPTPQIDLPLPRLQLRWAVPVEGAPGGGAPPPYVAQGGDRRWICHYELVLPLHEHDIRRERDGAPHETQLVIPISKTRRGSVNAPDDEPYRDGVHAAWDASVLGNLPVYVLPIEGPPVSTMELRAKRDALKDADTRIHTAAERQALDGAVGGGVEGDMAVKFPIMRRLRDLLAAAPQPQAASEGAAIDALRVARDALRKVAFVSHKDSLAPAEKVADIQSVADAAMTAADAALQEARDRARQAAPVAAAQGAGVDLAGMAPRDPDEAMLDAARDWSAVFVGSPIGNKAAIGCWQAMWDKSPAALATSRPNLHATAKDAAERAGKNAGVAPELLYAPILWAIQDTAVAALSKGAGAGVTAELRALSEQATPGPWFARNNSKGEPWIGDHLSDQHAKVIVQRLSMYRGWADYAFVAAAINDARARIEAEDRALAGGADGREER